MNRTFFPNRLAMITLALFLGVAGCVSDPRADLVYAGNQVHGQIQLLRLILTADRQPAPPVPMLTVSVRDAVDDLSSATSDIEKLPDPAARATLTSIVDRAVALAHRLDDEIGDGPDNHLDEIDRGLSGLLDELATLGVSG